jgi:splicing factor 45
MHGERRSNHRPWYSTKTSTGLRSTIERIEAKERIKRLAYCSANSIRSEFISLAPYYFCFQNKNVPLNVWDPLEPYDPLRPNDYNEYKVWKGNVSTDASDWLSNDEWKRRKDIGEAPVILIATEAIQMKNRPVNQVRFFFLGMTDEVTDVSIGRYDNECYDRWSRDDEERSRAPVPPPDDAPVVVDRNLSGEEAFQRRLALSAGLRRPPSPPPASVLPPPEPTAARDDDDDDYIPGPSISSTPPVAMADAGTTVEDPSHVPPPVLEQEVAFSSLAYNPFAPPSVPPPPPGPPGGPVLAAFEDKVKAAAAIAAKLGALAATANASEPSPPPATTVPPIADEITPSKKSVFSWVNLYCH